jgi:hypothetical protein
MMDNSIKLANLWVQLHGLKEKLDNEIIPVGNYLGVEDPELMIALEECSLKIQNHFERFRMVVVTNQNQQN